MEIEIGSYVAARERVPEATRSYGSLGKLENTLNGIKMKTQYIKICWTLQKSVF